MQLAKESIQVNKEFLEPQKIKSTKWELTYNPEI